MVNFDGQVAIVTGASRGLGRAIAKELAAGGASVVVNYRCNREKAEDVVGDIRALEGTAVSHRADVTNEDDVREMIASVEARFGRIDILVCNAGVVRDSLVASMPLEDWESVMHVNLRGAFLCIRETVPLMMRQKSGSIVNLSSVRAEWGGSGQSNYAASKAGVEALTRSLAIELAPKGIRVNAVSPGLIVTDMTDSLRAMAGDLALKQIPLRRYGDPMDVARAVSFLASSDASYITGAILPVAGGLGL